MLGLSGRMLCVPSRKRWTERERVCGWTTVQDRDILCPQVLDSCENPNGDKREKRTIAFWGNHRHNFTSDPQQVCAICSILAASCWSRHQWRVEQNHFQVVLSCRREPFNTHSVCAYKYQCSFWHCSKKLFLSQHIWALNNIRHCSQHLDLPYSPYN